MIKLRNFLGKIVYVNPNTIMTMECCNLCQVDTMTKVNAYITVVKIGNNFETRFYESTNKDKELGVLIRFVNGETLVVEECLKDIREKIDAQV